MIKVCHVSSAHKNDDARIFRLECVSLAAAGYDVYMVIEGESKDVQGVHIVGLGHQPESRIRRMTSFAKKAYRKALSLNCDIYHIHDPELLPYARKLKKHGKKVIFDSHENTLEQMTDKTWIPRILRGIVARSYREYASNLFKELDCLISVTPHIVDQLKDLNSNTYMVTNYPIITDMKERNCQQKEILSLCFTGGITPDWNHELIIETIDDIAGVQYNLCGRSNDEYLSVLQKTPGWKKVKYFGKVPFEKATQIQNESDVGVALLKPSNNTGGMIGTIGNTKLFEYLMAGLPIICTNFVLWKEIVDNYQCGVCVDSNDKKALRDAIHYMINNPDIVYRMGRNGRRAVEEKYNWKTQERTLLEIYKAIS